MNKRAKRSSPEPASPASAWSLRSSSYDPPNHQFLYNWKLGNGTGSETITITVSYANTVMTTTKTESITITR